MTGPSAALPEDELHTRPADEGAPPHFGEGSNAEVLLHRLELTVRRPLGGPLQRAPPRLGPARGCERGAPPGVGPGPAARAVTPATNPPGRTSAGWTGR